MNIADVIGNITKKVSKRSTDNQLEIDRVCKKHGLVEYDLSILTGNPVYTGIAIFTNDSPYKRHGNEAIFFIKENNKIWEGIVYVTIGDAYVIDIFDITHYSIDELVEYMLNVYHQKY